MGLSVARVPTLLLLCSAAAAGCGATSSAGSREGPPPTVAPPLAAGVPSPPVQATPAPSVAVREPLSPLSGIKPIGKPGHWRVTVYYTLVESFHHGLAKAVKGCAEFHCSHGTAPLGSYPKDFLDAVQIEGSGRITAGPQRGRYLNWSHSVGWWLDETTRDSAGKPLRPFGTAAADRDVLARGHRFVITDCGKGDDGRKIDGKVCSRLRSAEWTVTDLFRPGYGGEHHADLYIGEETGPNFSKSPWYTELSAATLYTR